MPVDFTQLLADFKPEFVETLDRLRSQEEQPIFSKFNVNKTKLDSHYDTGTEEYTQKKKQLEDTKEKEMKSVEKDYDLLLREYDRISSLSYRQESHASEQIIFPYKLLILSYHLMLDYELNRTVFGLPMRDFLGRRARAILWRILNPPLGMTSIPQRLYFSCWWLIFYSYASSGNALGLFQARRIMLKTLLLYSKTVGVSRHTVNVFCCIVDLNLVMQARKDQKLKKPISHTDPHYDKLNSLVNLLSEDPSSKYLQRELSTLISEANDLLFSFKLENPSQDFEVFSIDIDLQTCLNSLRLLDIKAIPLYQDLYYELQSFSKIGSNDNLSIFENMFSRYANELLADKFAPCNFIQKLGARKIIESLLRGHFDETCPLNARSMRSRFSRTKIPQESPQTPLQVVVINSHTNIHSYPSSFLTNLFLYIEEKYEDYDASNIDTYLRYLVAEIAESCLRYELELAAELMTLARLHFIYLEKSKKNIPSGFKHLGKFLVKIAPGKDKRSNSEVKAKFQEYLSSLSWPTGMRHFLLSLFPSSGVGADHLALLNQPRGLTDSDDEIRIHCLRRWGSDTSLFTWNREKEQNWGGGFFIYAGKDRGVAVDPGLDFLDLFYMYTPYRFSNISSYLITHTHIDHAGEFEKMFSISVKYAELANNILKPLQIISSRDRGHYIEWMSWTKEECRRWQRIRKLKNPSCCPIIEKKDQGLPELFKQRCTSDNEICPRQFPFINKLVVVKKTIDETSATEDTVSIPLTDTSQIDRNQWAKVVPFKAEHYEWPLSKLFPKSHKYDSNSSYPKKRRSYEFPPKYWTPDTPSDYSVGYKLSINPPASQMDSWYNILITGDFSYNQVSEFKKSVNSGRLNLTDTHVMIANISSVKSSELDEHNGDRNGGNHLGLCGLIDIVEIVKPKVLVITEINREQSFKDLRCNLLDLIKYRLNIKMGDEAPPVFLSELGLTFILRDGKILVECACSSLADEAREIYPNPVTVEQVKFNSSEHYNKNGELAVLCEKCKPLFSTPEDQPPQGGVTITPPPPPATSRSMDIPAATRQNKKWGSSPSSPTLPETNIEVPSQINLEDKKDSDPKTVT